MATESNKRQFRIVDKRKGKLDITKANLHEVNKGGSSGLPGVNTWKQLVDTPSIIEPLRTVRGDSTGNFLEFWDAEPAFIKNTGFNKDFGVIAGTVAEGNHTHNLSDLPNDVGYITIGDIPVIDQNNFVKTLWAGVYPKGMTVGSLTIQNYINTNGFTVLEDEVYVVSYSAWNRDIQYLYKFLFTRGKGVYNVSNPLVSIFGEPGFTFISRQRVTVDTEFEGSVETETIPLGDITGSTIEDYINSLSGTSYNLAENTVYFFTTVENGNNNTYTYSGTLPKTIGSGGTVTTADDFDLIAVNGVDVYNDIITSTQQLLNEGADGTSTYVETDELGAVAFDNDYNSLDNLPTIPSNPNLQQVTTVGNTTTLDIQALSFNQVPLDGDYFTVGIGTNALASNTGSGTNLSSGYVSGRFNSGRDVTLYGVASGNQNSGDFTNSFGQNSGNANDGIYLSSFGHNSGNRNKGDNSSFFGGRVGYSNIGNNVTGIGFESSFFNQGSNNTSLGYKSNYIFKEDTANLKNVVDASTDIDTVLNRITITTHGFGTIGTYVNLLYTTTGTPIGGLIDTEVYFFLIIDANTIEYTSDLSSVGTDTHTFTPQFSYSNITVLGANAEPTKSNQVVLGDSSVTEVDTYGAIRARAYGAGVKTGTPTYNLSVDANGNIIETANPAVGTTDYVSNVSLVGTDLTFTGVGSAFNSTVDLSSLGGDDVSTFAEKTGTLVGTDRLVGLSGTTDFSETISGIPLSIFNNDSGWTSNTGDALIANPLSQFAATTSAQLAGVISDETGSGALVFATSPTLVTPVLGVATATSINGATITSGTLNGSVTGTNTGDQTTIVGITGTKAQFDTAVTDGNFMYIGDAPTAHTHAISTDITGLGTGVATALGVNIGSAGAPILFNGALGTPTSGDLANCTFPTLNQSTTGSAATLTTTRTIWGQNFDGSANVTGALTGVTDITLSGLVDGRDIAADGTLLDSLVEGLLTDSSTIATSRNHVATDADGMNVSTSATDVTITIQDNTTVPQSVGTMLKYKRSAAGNVIIAYAGGVTGTTDVQTYNLNDVITLRKTATNTWEALNPPINLIGQVAQSATGDGTTTITWQNGNMFNFQFGAFNEVFTFTAPLQPGVFILKLVQDGIGSRTATFPASVKWIGGAAPTLTTTATTGTDIITFYFDGTNYFATSALNFS